MKYLTLSFVTAAIALTSLNVGANCQITGVGTAPNGGDDYLCDATAPNPFVANFNSSGGPMVGGHRLRITPGAILRATGGSVDDEFFSGGRGNDQIIVDGATLQSEPTVTSSPFFAGSFGMDSFIINNSKGEANAGVVGTSPGDASVSISNSDFLSVLEDVVSGSFGEQIITINHSHLRSVNDSVISTSHDDDTINIEYSIIENMDGNHPAINASNDNDTVNVSHCSEIYGGIELGNGTDSLTLGTLKALTGELGNTSGEGTLVFAQELNAGQQCMDTVAAVNALDPAGGSINIAGVTYTFSNMTTITNNIICGIAPSCPGEARPVPTLSTWLTVLLSFALSFSAMIAARRMRA